MRSLATISLMLWFAVPHVDTGKFLYPEVDASIPAQAVQRLTPGAPQEFTKEYNLVLNAPLEVARVLGRAPACENADADFIHAVARAAVREHVDARIIAATVAVESGCNPYAISTKGAVGLMQPRVSTWKGKYDFAGRDNLFNREANLRVGAQIMAGYIRQYGTTRGVQLYNGAGEGCETCDAGYSSKILQLAGRK